MKNTWDKNRDSNGWNTGLVDWTEDDYAFISVVFSWQIQQAYQRAIWYASQGYSVRVGGPAAILNPEPFRTFESSAVNALMHHNPNATFTTRGCIRKCPFCAVPKIEGQFWELEEWEPKPIVCDNNLLASSRKHFDKVIDKLKPLKKVDFQQGLDARLLTDYHAQRFAELDLNCIRLAWDNRKTEGQFRKAFATIIKAGIPSNMVRSYILIGFDDNPEDALYRLETVKALGGLPNPARYQPLDSKRRNEFIGKNWTNAELTRYMRYWANLRVTSKIPFSDFRNRHNCSIQNESLQERLV